MSSRISIKAIAVFLIGMVIYCSVLAWVVRRNLVWWPAYEALDYAVIREGFDYNFGWFPRVLAGVAVFFMLAGLQFSRVRGPLWLLGMLGMGAAGVVWFFRWYVTDFEHGRLVVRKVTFQSDKIREPFTLLHISDLEALEVGPHEKKALARAAALNADMVVFTGDWFELERGEPLQPHWEALKPHLSQFEPEFGFWGVYGDADGGFYRIPVSEESPLVMMDFWPKRIVSDAGNLIEIKALSLHQSRRPGVAEQHIRKWVESKSPDVFSILLGHGPDFIPDAIDYGVDLSLAGHTHGGQVRLPFYGPLTHNSDVPKDWSVGFHEVSNSAFNVSAGLGSDRHGDLPIIRFNCPTEMTLISVVPKL